MGTWIEAPFEGEVWRHRGPPQETRHVIDRTLGADVIFYRGNWKLRHRGQCSWAEWQVWVATAKRVE